MVDNKKVKPHSSDICKKHILLIKISNIILVLHTCIIILSSLVKHIIFFFFLNKLFGKSLYYVEVTVYTDEYHTVGELQYSDLFLMTHE